MTALFSACEFVEFDENGQQVTEGQSNLMLKSGSLAGGVIHVQKDVNTSITIMSINANNPVTEVAWTIEGQNYTGLSITHKFASLGNVTVAVSAKFQNNTTENKDFTLKVVKDMSPYDPIKIFVGTPTRIATGKWAGYDRWPVTILLSKERLANKTAYGYSGSFNDDTPAVWFAGVKVPTGDTNFIIENNLPVSVTNDVGKYIAVKRELIARDYDMAVGEFEKSDGTGIFMWGDWSGSAYVKAVENVGIIKFSMKSNGSIVPLGDGYIPVTDLAPGTAGDGGEGIFRTELSNGKFIAYFKLSSDFVNLTPFVQIKNQETGVWGTPVALLSVPNFPKYGKIELLEEQALNKIVSLRFGNTISTKIVDYAQMAKSLHFNSTFNEVRCTAIKQ